ncbi:MAG: hypothetical protein NTY53_00100, partial [Kiritimatiellaeota bacterium]|nr:hypothetical protein [Kiritimatiellota bacterium]
RRPDLQVEEKMTKRMNIKELGKARRVGDPAYNWQALFASFVGRVTSRGVFQAFAGRCRL